MMRTTRCLVLVAIAASIAILASPSSADQPVFADEKMIADVVERYRAFEWKDCRWQRFPDVVGGAVTGPDGRLWITLELPSRYPNPSSWCERLSIPCDLAERFIREQFQAARPILPGLIPILFERDGSVWFTRSGWRDELFGYDGKTIHRRSADEAGRGERFSGTCPGGIFNLNLSENRHITYNIELNGRLFFPDRGGIHEFAEGVWTYTRLFPSINRPANLTLHPFPGSDGLLVHASLNDEHKVWRRGKDEWAVMDGIGRTLQDALPLADGRVLLFHRDRQPNFEIRRFAESARRGHELVAADILSSAPDRRVSKAVELGRAGELTVEAIDAALERTFDGDLVETLLNMRKSIIDGDSTLDGIHLNACSLENDDVPQGIAHLRINGERGGEKFENDLVRLATSTTKIGRVPWADWRGRRNPEIPGISRWMAMIPVRDGLWMHGISMESPTVKIDETRAAVVDRIPVDAFSDLHSVLADGTVVVSLLRQNGPPNSHASRRCVALYRPGRPDDPHALAESSRAVRRLLELDEEGAVWATATDGRLERYDGKAWGTSWYGDGTKEVVELLIGGRGGLYIGTVRREGDSECRGFIRTARGIEHGDDLVSVIASHHPEIVKAFSGLDRWSRNLRRPGEFASLVVDEESTVWISAPYRIGPRLAAVDEKGAITGKGKGNRLGIHSIPGRGGVYIWDDESMRVARRLPDRTIGIGSIAVVGDLNIDKRSFAFCEDRFVMWVHLMRNEGGGSYRTVGTRLLEFRDPEHAEPLPFKFERVAFTDVSGETWFHGDDNRYWICGNGKISSFLDVPYADSSSRVTKRDDASKLVISRHGMAIVNSAGSKVLAQAGTSYAEIPSDESMIVGKDKIAYEVRRRGDHEERTLWIVDLPSKIDEGGDAR